MLDALGHLASVMTAQGQLREAKLLCLKAVEQYVDARGEPVPVAGLVYVPLGVLYYEMNDLESARHYLDQRRRALPATGHGLLHVDGATRAGEAA